MRRALLISLVSAPLLAACGFKLRGTQQLPFERIYIGAPANSALGADLARRITAGTQARVVDDPKQAQAVLEILNESRTREVLSVNAQGRAREFMLQQSLSFRLHDGKGHELLGPTQIAVKRDISFDESQALAFESETEFKLLLNGCNKLIYRFFFQVGALNQFFTA
jgi:LPS-assembly lipoprotein